MPQHPGPLGWIEPANRTADQNDAHDDAHAKMKMVNFALTPVTLNPGQKIMLTDAWRDPDVVSDIGMEFPGFHQLTGSCFPAGTPVRMADGSEKPIEEIRVGDRVVTHTGDHQPVRETMRRNYAGEMTKILISGFPFPIEMTADHPVAVVNYDHEIVWKDAEDLEKGDRVLIGWNRQKTTAPTIDLKKVLGDRCIDLDELMKDAAYTQGNEPRVPVRNITMARHIIRQSGFDWRGRVKLVRTRTENAVLRHVPINASFARLIGLYLAEGGVCEGRVTFTFNAAERETLAGEVLTLVRGLFGVEGEIESVQEDRETVCRVRFQNQNLAEIFAAIVPGNVYSKRVPGLFFQSDERIKLTLLLGWMAGDGHAGIKKSRKDGCPGNVRLTGVSASPGLIRDMTVIALSCGVRSTAGRRKARGRSRVAYTADLSGRKAVSLFETIAHRASGKRYRDGDAAQTPYGYARKIRKIERRPVRELPVFDFEVEHDHSFLAGDIVVHNCVGASGGNGIFTVGAVQRKLAENPTVAFIPWWLYPYGKTRYAEGDRGQGEGAVDSVMGQILGRAGNFAATQPGLPQFKTDDGLYLDAHTEMQWSDGGSSLVTKWDAVAAPHLLGSAAPIYTTDQMVAAIVNGYPILTGCSYYVGSGKIVGSGDQAYVRGHYDGRGGHSTCRIGVWNHPNDGLLIGYSNQWPTSTYPKDPAGLGRCCVWVPISEEQKMLSSYGGGNGETMALSHLNWFPAQPAVEQKFSWYV